jgi:membrane-bound metal-dependent hydrolase YbcI (DUF457 family)
VGCLCRDALPGISTCSGTTHVAYIINEETFVTGPSHRLMAASGAILFGASPVEAAVAVLGGTLPDRIEKVGLPHRGVSHWPWPWALAVWSLWSQQTQWGILAGWWFAGALFHIGADLFTVGGVPLLLPNWRWRLGVIHNGSYGEYITVAFFILAAIMRFFHLQIVSVAGL